MKPLLSLSFLEPKKANHYWQDDQLLGQEQIIREICEVNQEINAAYLIGSLVEIKGKDYYKRKPEDMDIYLWGEDYLPSDVIDHLTSRIESLEINDLPVHIIDRPYHPFETYKNDFLDIQTVHPLYVNRLRLE
ncbi:MAG: hypothetical protein ACLFP2_00695 [Candidatus Woesearchaeota archaeon]